ncbi:MAG: ribonuclease Z [Thermoprotei archaeon]|jgi:ribonuclease Z
MILLTFLGTAASIPAKDRSLPSIAFNIDGDLILMDVGEGTQRQMLYAGLSPQKVMKVLITHMHGDHILGLPGLIRTMAMLGRTQPLEIYGPKGIASYVNLIIEPALLGSEFKILVNEVSHGTSIVGKNYFIEAISVNHGVEAYGYVLKTNDRPGKLDISKALSLGLKPGPELRMLKEGKIVRVGGKIIRPEDVLGEPMRGSKIVYSGDTLPSENIVKSSMNADILIHEATFIEDDVNLAKIAYHTTVKQAANIALNANVGLLILTHISNRYQNLNLLLNEARGIFYNTLIANDFLTLHMT